MHKKCLILIINLLIALSSLMGQSSALPTGANNDMPVIVNDSLMFIGQHVDSLTEEQRYFNPIYLIVQKGKEYLKNQLIHASVCDCDTTIPNRRIGVFSVAPNKYVSFSQGNLQYFPSANLWKFADNQYEYLGASNKYLSPTYRNWIDLFGWSSDSGKAPFGVSTSTNIADYKGEFVDWGNNWICGDAANTWRTLSHEEWKYLFSTRLHAQSLFGFGKVAGVNGLIILPDDWKLPTGITFAPSMNNGFIWDSDKAQYKSDSDGFLHNTYTAEQWALMEQAGAVFLPAAGSRYSSNTYDIGNDGNYWASTHYDEYKTYLLDFYSNRLGPQDNYYLLYGFSVRLVHDTILPQSIPCETFEVNGVTFNMMCVEGSTFMMGAMEGDSTASKNEFPQHSVTLSNYMIGQTEITKAQWLAVMGDKPKSASSSWLTADPQTPANYVTWSECVEFADRLSQLTGHNFRLPTEAEWEFAARGGTLSRGYRYSGSNNLNEVGWYIHNRQQTTHPVATKLPNELGIYDMSGNVWEWCLDSPKDYKDYAQLDPLPAFVNNQRVIRGGAYERDENRCTTSHRTTWLSAWSQKGANTGFRVVLNDEHIIRTILLPDSIAFNMKHINGSTFMIGQTEVTRALWETVMGSLPYNYTATDLPIARVTWNECQEFINQLNSLTGLYFRFPTKDEWLYAAKGGQHQEEFLYSGSNNIDEVGWYKDNSPSGIQSVAQLKPNALGIYDMTGNVWEWVAKNASGSCMYLGGSYAFSAESCLLSKALGYGNDSTHTGSIGLRLVLDTIQPFEPEYVDLGLSVKWANYNLGASTPTEVGDYYAWGEIEPKDSYTTANYQWCKGSAKTFTKYCTIDSMGYNGFTDGLTTLQSQDDAAQMQKGGHWRMPSDTEWNELLKNCTWTQAEQGGQIGYIATSKINGNHIFIPVAGFRAGGNVILEYIGAYWSSTLNEAKQSCAYGLYINKDENSVGRYSNSGREYGFLIRPVYDENYHAYTDLGLSVMWATCNVGATKPEEYGDYFAWGETEPQDIYSWETYKWCDGTSNYITKYNAIDGLTTLQEEDDAAYINWGGNWRMPSRNELTELHTLCTWEWTARNGVNGHIVTGPNGNSIFIPAGGSYNQFNNENITIGKQGWLLASNRASTQSAYELGTKPNGSYQASCSRCCGLNIRPVYRNNTTNPVQPVKPDSCKTLTINGVIVNMIYVEGGTFMMGATPEQGTDATNDEKPVHEVTLSDYYIGQTEVTQALWKAIMGTTISEHANQYGHESGPIAGEGDLYPMYKINTDDCQRFIDSLNNLTGLHFRLPTEAEWEYAARGGKYSRGYKYPGGNNLDELAWYSNNSNNATHPVAKKQPNELGIYDMAGNVWERTSDWYGIYSSDTQINPTGPTSGTQGVIRGGSRASSYGATNCRVSARLAYTQTKRTFIGLRLVLDKD